MGKVRIEELKRLINNLPQEACIKYDDKKMLAFVITLLKNFDNEKLEVILEVKETAEFNAKIQTISIDRYGRVSLVTKNNMIQIMKIIDNTRVFNKKEFLIYKNLLKQLQGLPPEGCVKMYEIIEKYKESEKETDVELTIQNASPPWRKDPKEIRRLVLIENRGVLRLLNIAMNKYRTHFYVQRGGEDMLAFMLMLTKIDYPTASQMLQFTVELMGAGSIGNWKGYTAKDIETITFLANCTMVIKFRNKAAITVTSLCRLSAFTEDYNNIVFYHRARRCIEELAGGGEEFFKVDPTLVERCASSP